MSYSIVPLTQQEIVDDRFPEHNKNMIKARKAFIDMLKELISNGTRGALSRQMTFGGARKIQCEQFIQEVK